MLARCQLPHGPFSYIRYANVVVYPRVRGRSKFVAPLILPLSGS